MYASLAQLYDCFREKSPAAKVGLLAGLDDKDPRLAQTLATATKDVTRAPEQTEVGYPTRPMLVDARKLPKRSLASVDGRGAFFHAICHIEFTAINLALDAVLRFPGMPEAYYADWLRIAKEEALHFDLLQNHLAKIGFRYGDFDAHDGMWQLAERTSHDVMLRMGLVPRVLEARGLDVTPPMIERLQQAGDDSGASLLARIYADEIGHVAAGTRWFNYAAHERGMDPEDAFVDIVEQEFGKLRLNQFNQEGRLLAGFTQQELERINSH